MTSKNGFKWILLTVVVVRAFVFFHARGLEYGTSAAFKLGDTARNLLEGRGFVWDPAYLQRLNEESRKRDAINPQLELFEEVPPPPLNRERLQPFRGRPPGYSAVVAATWKIFGKKYFAYSQAFFSVLDVGVCLIVWWLALQFFGPSAAFAAGLVYALMLPNAVLAILPGHDAIGAFPLAVGALFFWLFLTRGRIYFLVFCGLVLGLGTLIRQEPYLVPVVFSFALVLCRQWKKALQTLIIAQLMIVAVNLPWTMYNKRHFDKAIPLSPAAAATLLAGIGDFPNPWGVKASDLWLRDFVTSKVGFQPYHSLEFNRVCMEEFLRIVKEAPGWYAMSVVKRAAKSLSPTIMPFRNSYTFYKLQGNNGGPLQFAFHYPLQAALPVFYKLVWLFLWAFSLLTLILCWFGRDDERRAFALALFGMPVYYLLSHVLMHCEARFLLPGYFPLVILGTAGAIQSAINLLNKRLPDSPAVVGR